MSKKTAVEETTTEPNPLRDKFFALERELETIVLDRSAEIHSATLALLSNQHMFMLGEPGVGKSFLVDQLTMRIRGANKFRIQLQKTTAAEELYGGPNIKVMAETGQYVRVTTGMAPEAEILDIDECFNGSSAILNTLLKVVEERVFFNGGQAVNVPLISAFGASNSIPTTPELEAFFDRLLLRHIVTGLADDAQFAKMLTMEVAEPTAFVDIEDIRAAQLEVAQVQIPDHLIKVLLDLRHALSEAEIKVSDRRYRKAMSIIKAEAWMNGRTVATTSDAGPLAYVMWRDPSHFNKVRDMVLDLADPLEKEISDLRTTLEECYSEFRRVMGETDNNNTRARQMQQTTKYITQTKKAWVKLNKQAQEANRFSPTLMDLKRRIREIGPAVLQEAGGYDSETAKEMDASMDVGGDFE